MKFFFNYFSILLMILSFFLHFGIVLTLRDKNTFFPKTHSKSSLASFHIFVTKEPDFHIKIYLCESLSVYIYD